MLTNEDVLAATRELCRRSFSDFIRLAWPNIIPDRLQWNWHIDAVAEHLQAVSAGQINRLLINVPPGTSKSTITGVMYPAWLWGPGGQPHHRYIGAAHEQGLAIRDNRLMRELVLSPWYQELWPTNLKGDQNEKLYFENDKRGFRQACAVSSMTGRRGHTIAWDDALNPSKANSQAHRDDAIRVLTETVPTRLNDPERSAIIVVMQRLHEEDPSGYILANDLGYEHLCIPMEFEPDRRKTTSIGWTDPRTKEGELLDPVRFPQHVIDRDKKAMGSYAWAGQMQQRPAPRGGGLIKDAWWKYYEVLPPLKWRGIWADTAQKAKEANDYSVFECWGETEDGKAVLIDLIRGKWEAPELLAQARAFWAKHKAMPGDRRGALRSFRIEDKVSGTGLIQTLQREGVPVQGIQRDSDKVTRVMDVAPSIEAGLVLLPSGASFLSDFLAETSAFPNGAHDDQVDPMADAVADIVLRRGAGYSWSGF
jgi:predicted phage terminase large subunit-like protein